MSLKSYSFDPSTLPDQGKKTLAYLAETFQPEDEVLAEIRRRTRESGLPEIEVGPMDGLHLEVLTRLARAKKAVEIGTLAGYSGTCIARALEEGGKLYTFEADRKHAEVARESFQKAGMAARTEIFVGPALANLGRIEREGPFDLVFIDADKNNYPAYLEWAANHLRVGGVAIGDNTLGWGMITDTSFADPADEPRIRGLQAFNRQTARGGRFRATLLPTGEGLTVAVKVR